MQPGGPPILHAVVTGLVVRRARTRRRQDHHVTDVRATRHHEAKLRAYRDALAEAGHDPSQFEIPFMQQTWVGDPAKLPQVAEAALEYYRRVGKVIPGSDEAIAAEAEYYEKVRANLDLLTLEQTLTHGGNFGSVDQVVDTLGRLATELGVTHYICWFRIPSLDRRVALEAMETFASEVIPQLRDLEPTPVATPVTA